MYQFVWECWCNLSPWDYFIINSICGSILQDKHLEKAYEINLMEELTLKGITQVSSITGSLFFSMAKNRKLGHPPNQMTSKRVSLSLLSFGSLHWTFFLPALCNGSNFRITTVHKSLAWVDKLMFHVFYFSVLCIPWGETESALSEYIVLQGIFLLHYFSYNIS